VNRVAVLGLGSWGTALAVRLGERGSTVLGWTHDPEQRRALARDRENRKYLPGLRLPERIALEDTPEDAVRGAEMIVLAVPSFAVREIAGAARTAPGVPIVNVAKGLEEGSRKRMLTVLAEELGPDQATVSLLGPSHAEEVAAGHPTAVVAASRDPEAARETQALFTDATFRVYTHDDVVGVELAAALKNVIALASGIALGLGYGDNTLGALLTRGLAEITRLGLRLGARAETFYGLSGVGDLVTTCASPHSRNRRVGEAVGRGEPLERVLAGMTMVAEGVRTTRAARALGEEVGVELPIVDRVHAVLFEGEDPRDAIRSLMTREPKAESPGRRAEQGER
jgi:glycerol-3-phosphate dehydrogenase (NAD(P)+)